MHFFEPQKYHRVNLNHPQLAHQLYQLQDDSAGNSAVFQIIPSVVSSQMKKVAMFESWPRNASCLPTKYLTQNRPKVLTNCGKMPKFGGKFESLRIINGWSP